MMYRQTGSDFLIGKFSPISGGARISCKGNMGAPTVGGEYVLIGHYEEVPKYGKTFIFTDYEVVRSQPTQINAIASYLASNVQGVGVKISQRLTDYYGEATLKKLKQKPHVTAQETGQCLEICERIQENLLLQEKEESVDIVLRTWFLRANQPKYLISKIKDFYNCNIDKLMKNPYMMIASIRGMSFRVADELAQSNGLAPNSIERLKAACQHALSLLNKDDGHTCVKESHLLSEVHELTSIGDEVAEDAIHELIAEGVFQKAPNNMIGFLKHVDGEKYIAQELLGRLKRGNKTKYDQNQLDCYGLACEQSEAVYGAMNNPVFILSGSAGTGKTTTLKSIVKNIQLNEPNNKIKLLCPTGKASKRASAVTRINAQTLHRALEATSTGNGFIFRKGQANKLDVDILIIDEASMITVEMMVNLIEALPLHTKIILVGDPNQLPPIGAGKVLDDLLCFKEIPSIKLKTIQRQDKQGLIIKNSELINRGMEMIIPTSEPNNDCYFSAGNETKTIMDICVSLLVDKIPRNYEADPINDIQILVPSPDKGDLSAKNFNIYVQHLLKHSNPFENPTELSWIGDKVINCVNDPERGLVNGDTGIVVKVTSKNYVVEFDDTVAEIPIKNNNLKLAYAVTSHKYQGSEVPYVILPLHKSFSSVVCTRNWLYTSITRATKVLFIVGDWKQTSRIISRKYPNLRQTSLGQHLTQVWNDHCSN
jgi:exodeoxyribonuclease V alpha subunit